MKGHRLLNGLAIASLLLPALLSSSLASTQAAEPLTTLRTTEAADEPASRQAPRPIQNPATPLSGLSALSASAIQTPTENVEFTGHVGDTTEALSLEGDGLWMSIQPPHSVVTLRETFTVAVAIENAPEITGYDFNMDWNPAVFFVDQVTKTGFLGTGGGLLRNIDNETGTLTFARYLITLPAELPSGDGDLAIITLRATDLGTSTLDLYATRVFTRSGQVGIPNPGDGTAESVCDVVEILDVAADSPVAPGHASTLTATVTGSRPITYTWDFESDGSPDRVGTGLDTVTHIYPGAGIYTVTLTVENACSDDTDQAQVTVEPGAEIVDLAARSPVTLGQTTTFTATVTGAQPITYTWDFESDGSPERIGTGLDTVTHVYPAVGIYTVTLTAENATGSDTEQLGVKVDPEPGKPVDVTIAPSAITLTAGECQAFTLTARDAYDDTWDVTADAAFEINAEAGGTWADNEYCSEVAGTWTVTGSYQGLESAAELTVEPAPYRVYIPLTLRRWPLVPESPTLYAIDNPGDDRTHTRQGATE